MFLRYYKLKVVSREVMAKEQTFTTQGMVFFPTDSAALSLDRIAIRYGNGKKLLVSPADKKGFLEAIGQSGKGF